jgi:hypothetical protein
MEKKRTKPADRPFVTEEPKYKWVKKGKTPFTLRDGRVVSPGEQFEAPLSMIPAPFRNMFTQMGMVMPQEQNAADSAGKQVETVHIPHITPSQDVDAGNAGDVEHVQDNDTLPEVDVDAHEDVQVKFKPVYVSSGFYNVVDVETGQPVQDGKKFRLAKANELCDELNNQ